MPVRTTLQRAAQVCCQACTHPHARFDIQRLEFEDTLRTMGLRIDPSNQTPTMQDGEYEVTVLAFFGWRVTLDRVVEPEQRARALAVPYDRIEWRQHRGHRGSQAAGDYIVQLVRHVAVHERICLPVIDSNGDQLTRVGQFMQR